MKSVLWFNLDGTLEGVALSVWWSVFGGLALWSFS